MQWKLHNRGRTLAVSGRLKLSMGWSEKAWKQQPEGVKGLNHLERMEKSVPAEETACANALGQKCASHGLRTEEISVPGRDSVSERIGGGRQDKQAMESDCTGPCGWEESGCSLNEMGHYWKIRSEQLGKKRFNTDNELYTGKGRSRGHVMKILKQYKWETMVIWTRRISDVVAWCIWR